MRNQQIVERPNLLKLMVAGLLTLLVFFVGIEAASAQTSPEGEPASSEQKQNLSPKEPATEESDEERARKERLLSAYWILLTGILILAIFIFASVLTLGARTRRIARKASPKTDLKQEFWYLKNPAEQKGEPSSDPEDEARG